MDGPNNLKALTTRPLSDYEREWPDSLVQWAHSSKVPASFRDCFTHLPRRISVFNLLMRIRKVVSDLYGSAGVPARSFVESRFSSIEEVLAKKITSCGALCTITAAALRQFNIPVKLVHGSIEGQNENDRHCWLQIYCPATRGWCSVDPTSDDFQISHRHHEIKTYVSWADMRADYAQGHF